MIIDCDSCEVRNIACDDCVVSVLLAAPPAFASGDIEWSEDESGALRALAAGGLVPPVQMRVDRFDQSDSAVGDTDVTDVTDDYDSPENQLWTRCL